STEDAPSRRAFVSFPTRRSSDLGCRQAVGEARLLARGLGMASHIAVRQVGPDPDDTEQSGRLEPQGLPKDRDPGGRRYARTVERSEEHTSELQSRGHLVCRLLLE